MVRAAGTGAVRPAPARLEERGERRETAVILILVWIGGKGAEEIAEGVGLHIAAERTVVHMDVPRRGREGVAGGRRALLLLGVRRVETIRVLMMAAVGTTSAGETVEGVGSGARIGGAGARDVGRVDEEGWVIFGHRHVVGSCLGATTTATEPGRGRAGIRRLGLCGLVGGRAGGAAGAFAHGLARAGVQKRVDCTV